MSERLGHDEYLEHIGADSVIACDVGRQRGDANPQVPNCPAWSLADLLDHVAVVHNFWTAQLAAAADRRTDPEELAEAAGETPAAVAEVLELASVRLLEQLRATPPERACWNWSGRDQTAAWVARRMALETAVHRADAEQAVGRVPTINSALAADGLDERIAVHLACDVPEAPEASLGGSLCLACSDVDRAFVLEVGGGRLEWREGRGPADAVVVGRASDLFLFSWNRVGLDALSLTGRRQVAEAWSTLPV